MTDREKAIVMAYTGVCTLQGDKLNEFYKYLADLYGRPVYTHEIVDLDIAEKSKADFVRICHDEQPEHKNGHWIGRGIFLPICSECHGNAYGRHGFDAVLSDYCPHCGAEMTEESNTCDTCLHEKEPWSMQCHQCEDFNLWEAKE